MTESDLFTELLDDKEVDRIIKAFKIVMDGFRPGNATIEKKRQTLKQAFKSGVSRKKNGPGFFFDVISTYNLSLEGIEDGSYLEILSESQTPDFIKLGYSIVHRNHITKKILPVLIKRHLSGEKPLFNYSESIDSEEKATQVVRSFFGLDKPTFVETWIISIENSFNVQQKETLSKITNEIKDLKFHEFIKIKKNLVEKYEEKLILYTYAKIRSDLDPMIRSHYLFLGSQYQVNYLIDASSKESKAAAERHKVAIKELKAENQRLEKLSQASKNDKETIAQIQSELKQFKEHTETKEEEFEARHLVKLGDLSEKHEKELDVLRHELEVVKEGLIRSLDRISTWAGDREPCEQFSFIYSNPSHLFLELYPEITAYPIKEWDKHIEELITFPVVYVQRDGCSTAVLAKIQKNIKNIKVFNASGDKELIEHIEEIKKKEGVLFVTV